ncbi:MAG TPA: 4Fe-4S dicluster domain-containing protein [Candidatus Limnocylindrales bacterium]|nr:4Fe-4S dicluster domain-containing protein [Candidatus Limnocylindrales bacterium]
MATVITEECINCGACEPECPNTAIYQGGVEYEWQGVKHAPLSNDFFFIVPAKCTECVGFFDHEACAAVCPVDCCVPDPKIPETEAQLIERARQLHPGTDFAADFPSRFRKDGGSAAAAGGDAAAVASAGAAAAAPAASAAAPSPAAPAAKPAPSAKPAAAAPEPAATQAASLEDFDVPIVCKSCEGEYSVGFRFITPGINLRCPHCGVSQSPTQQMYVLVSQILERYTSRLDAEIERHRRAEEAEQRRFEQGVRELREDVEGEIRRITSRMSAKPKRSFLGLG